MSTLRELDKFTSDRRILNEDRYISQDLHSLPPDDRCTLTKQERDIFKRKPIPKDYLDEEEYSQDIEFLEILYEELSKLHCCGNTAEACDRILEIVKQKINELTNAKDAIDATYRRKASELGFRYDTGHRVYGKHAPVQHPKSHRLRNIPDVIDETKIFGGILKRRQIIIMRGWRPKLGGSQHISVGFYHRKKAGISRIVWTIQRILKNS